MAIRMGMNGGKDAGVQGSLCTPGTLDILQRHYPGWRIATSHDDLHWRKFNDAIATAAKEMGIHAPIEDRVVWYYTIGQLNKQHPDWRGINATYLDTPWLRDSLNLCIC